MQLEGFSYFPNFISKEEEKEIIINLSHLEWQAVKMYGVIAKRKVMHFGMDYTYQTKRVKPTQPPPSFITLLINRSALLLEIEPTEIVETLITYYPVGAGIGWHKDAPIFGDKIFGISLNSQCIMKFRIKNNNQFEMTKTILEPRSAYILSGPARWEWQHHIPSIKEERYSITFRTVK